MGEGLVSPRSSQEAGVTGTDRMGREGQTGGPGVPWEGSRSCPSEWDRGRLQGGIGVPCPICLWCKVLQMGKLRHRVVR